MLTIALAQMEVIAGQPERNLNTMKQWITEAQQQGADLVVFPRRCISGMHLGSRYESSEFLFFYASLNEEIKQMTSNIGVIWGNVQLDPVTNQLKDQVCFAYEGKWSQALYTSLSDNTHILPVSDLLRFIFKGHSIVVTAHDETVAVKEQVQDGADYVVQLAAQPWYKPTFNHANQSYATNEKTYGNDSSAIYVYVNGIGMSNSGKNVYVYDGGSYVCNASKNVITANDFFEAELLVVQANKDSGLVHLALMNHVSENTSSNRQQASNYVAITPSSSSPSRKLLSALVYAIQKFDAVLFNGKVPWVIGLSGGLDSSISAALLVMALGHQRVLAYNLQTSFSSTNTIDNAKTLANKLGLQLRSGVISDLVAATVDVATRQFGYEEKDLQGLVHENIQARIRGHLLSTFAAIHRGVICNNGNKVEVALGYCTLYGDSVGALGLLGDLLKVELFDLAETINGGYQDEVIPRRLLPIVGGATINWEMAPSAELRSNQLDPMKWFYHDALIDYLTGQTGNGVEALMERYLNGSLLKDPVFGRWLKWYGLNNPVAFIEDLEWLLRNMNLAVFKRIQLPPIITLSQRAYGRQPESQMVFAASSQYQLLKEQILRM